MAVVFTEAFVGGLFGFWKNYSAVVRIETDSAESLNRDWIEALERVREWRDVRGSTAVWISFYFIVPKSISDEVRSFIGDVVNSPREKPTELAGLAVDLEVFDPDGGVLFE